MDKSMTLVTICLLLFVRHICCLGKSTAHDKESHELLGDYSGLVDGVSPFNDIDLDGRDQLSVISNFYTSHTEIYSVLSKHHIDLQQPSANFSLELFQKLQFGGEELTLHNHRIGKPEKIDTVRSFTPFGKNYQDYHVGSH